MRLNFLKKIMKKSDNKDIERKEEISGSLKKNKKYISGVFDNCYDIKMREFFVFNNPKLPALLVYISNLTPDSIIEEGVMQRLTENLPDNSYGASTIDYIKGTMGLEKNTIIDDMNKAVDAILNGFLVLFIDGINYSIIINLKSPPGRSIDRPEEEASLRGPREAFIETLAINTSLIRKKIKNKYLKMEHMTIGKQTKSDIVICYLSNLANPEILDEVKHRLNKIDIDSVLDTNFIDEYISDKPNGIFPTIFRTEKPDVASSKLLEGRILIFIDGAPSVISIPSTFIEFLTVGEDYYLKFIPTTLNRWIRYILFFLSIVLPGFYVALLTFHQELIPTGLLISIVKARGNIPFSAFTESFVALFIFDSIREAGLRMPKNLGQAISIVGALVLGEAAVGAGLISEMMLIVIAFTGISSFVVPYPEMMTSILVPRVIFLILGGTLGLLGLSCGLIMMLCTLVSKRSFGVPYMSPIAPLVVSELDDSIVRMPLSNMTNRPKMLLWRKSNRRKKRNIKKKRG